MGAHPVNEAGFCVCLNRGQLYLRKRTDEAVVLTEISPTSPPTVFCESVNYRNVCTFSDIDEKHASNTDCRHNRSRAERSKTNPCGWQSRIQYDVHVDWTHMGGELKGIKLLSSGYLQGPCR
jgi:hypothetical protein